jgi:hypothetical protein
MSNIPINQVDYNDLFGYTILLGSNASFSGPFNSLNLNNGFWAYNTSVAGTLSGTIIPSDSTQNNYTAAVADFYSTTSPIGLYNTILGYASTAPTIVTSGYTSYTLDTTTLTNGSETITLNPIYIYTASNLDLTTTPIIIRFELTEGSLNDEFFIIVDGYMSLYNVTLELGTGVEAWNIYWLITGTVEILGTDELIGTFLYRGELNTFTTDSPVITGNIYTDNGGTLQFTSEVELSILMTGQTTTCFLEGSKILTEFGYKAIEDLKVGDKIITKGEINNDDYINKKSDYNSEPIIWLGSFTPMKKNINSFPICIKKNALGENLPFEDLFVSPLHRIILYGKMIPAENLVNGDTIFQDTSKKSIVYYHLELPNHYSIIANGILTETYKDFGNKHVFDKNQIPLSNEIIQPLEILA